MNTLGAFAEVKSVLVEIFEVDPESVVPEARLMDDLGLDSIDGVDMMVQFQEKTGKKVTPAQFESVVTVKDLADLVEELSR